VTSPAESARVRSARSGPETLIPPGSLRPHCPSRTPALDREKATADLLPENGFTEGGGTAPRIPPRENSYELNPESNTPSVPNLGSRSPP
jgi:hypothetical protein